MKAEIITVGTELLLGDVVNTNAAEISRMLAEVGVGVYHQSVVGDNSERLAGALSTALGRVDLLVVCGGLGPTEDDLTRETLAELLDLPLERDEGWVNHLYERYAHRASAQSGAGPEEPGSPGLRSGAASGGPPRGSDRPQDNLPKNNLRQAMVPRGAALLPNSRGTAPGIYLDHAGVTIVLLPGPPGEMRALMREQVLPRLIKDLSAGDRAAVLVSRVLRIVGVGESRVAELLETLLAGQSNPTIAPLAHLGEVHLRITAHAPDRAEADRRIDKTAGEIRAVLGDAVYGENETTLEAALGALLTERGLTVALAESCTGGLVTHRLTDVPGSSRYLLGSFVTYSNQLKTSVLGVDPALIERDGAVSETVALAMARGAREAAGSDLAVAITGIAGPGGGTEEKPVGLVWFAVADADGEASHRYMTHGSRAEVKLRASQKALELLRGHLLEA